MPFVETTRFVKPRTGAGCRTRHETAQRARVVPRGDVRYAGGDAAHPGGGLSPPRRRLDPARARERARLGAPAVAAPRNVRARATPRAARRRHAGRELAP